MSSRVWGGIYRKMGDKNRITALLPHLVRDLFNPTNKENHAKLLLDILENVRNIRKEEE